MAWQSPSAMNGGGANGGGDGNAPAGTEYTLQGVMRFLQLEWHNHERARNAWDIERAEMKAKIAKQEGEVRSAKKLNDQLNKHIRMLEQALTNERKKKSEAAGGDAEATTDDKNDPKGKKSGRNSTKPQNKKHNSFLDVDSEFLDRAEADRENLREKSKLYLTKCVEEITYLLTPPPQAPQQQQNMQPLANGNGYMNHGEASMEDIYLQQHRQRLQSQLPTMPGTSMPTHQPPNVPVPSELQSLANQHQIHHAPQMAREPSQQQPLPSNAAMAQELLAGHQRQVQNQQHFSSVPEEQVEKVTHAFDNEGRQIPLRGDDASDASQAANQDKDTDDWIFDPASETAQDGPPRRPDTEEFPSADSIPAKSPPRPVKRASKDHVRRLSNDQKAQQAVAQSAAKNDPQSFKVRFALRGHLDVVRSVIFTGGGSPSEPEICTAGDDGMIKRWMIPASYANQHSMNNDLDIQPFWSHRGHEGTVTSLAACPASAHFATGGRVSGDGWIFSGGQDATIRVWERGRVDPKATLEGHTDAVWTVCVLPTNCANLFGADSSKYGGPDRVILASGSADGTIKIWAVSAPPQLVSPQTGSRRGVGGSRRHSVTSGSHHPSSPQPSIATTTPFHHTLIHTIERDTHPSPTCISPLSPTGENFVVSFSDASILVYDTRTGEELIGMASNESYDGTPATGITSVVTSSQYLEGSSQEAGRGGPDEEGIHGPTGSANGGLEGVVISGHEDHLIRFFDANSGQCTYSMLAHPAAISSLSLSKDGREAVSAGHDASIRFWSLDKRICTQEITAHRIMRGEGGDGIVKLVALPQSIQSAKELYDLRLKYKDASVLITAIYSESMVIAASLSQVQSLLQHDALREKPQLLETFDRALTGCRVVYGCLEEEVRDLRVKAENDNLKFKDKAKFVFKEETFKELLTQIRGQQSALSLLIQGLQMESIADIKKLVEDNSVTLDQVVKRSRTLRQSHPRLKVPESLFDRKGLSDNEADVESIAKATEFTFDDEVVNSKAYRRAMAIAMSTSRHEIDASEETGTAVPEDSSIAPETTPPSVLKSETEREPSPQATTTNEHADLFDTLERDILSFMPQTSSTTLCLTPNHTGSKSPSSLPNDPYGSLTPAPLRSFSGDSGMGISEAAPPLPPRRPSEQHVATPQMRSVSSDDSMFSSIAPSILSKASTGSSYTVYETPPLSPNSTGIPSRKPLPFMHKPSYNAQGNAARGMDEVAAAGASLPLYNVEMHSIWMSLAEAERKFIDRIMRLKRMFYDNIIKQWPVLEKHMDAILIGEQLATLHQQYLLQAMDRDLAGSTNALCNPYMIDIWVDKSQQLYREYCRKMPHAASSLRTTQNLDPKFTPFVNTLGLSIAYFGKSWQDYLELPQVQMQSYIDSLQRLVSIADSLNDPTANQEAMRLRRALQAVTWLKTSISTLLDEAQAREDVQNLQRRIRTDALTFAQLRLHEPARRVIHQGGMAMKFKSQGSWVPVHAMLLDNYFIWGKAKKSKGDEVLITDPPIAVADMDLSLPTDAYQFQKATMLDQIARGSVVYIITINNKAQPGKPSLLGLYGFPERRDWFDHFTAAGTKFQR
ncbi:hypothetical protein J4E81_009895 [Alternaria sp. BMP 2799]|nr:hypothetical protein J4E81_009895 [Alternaria sp. BMP 2799]